MVMYSLECCQPIKGLILTPVTTITSQCRTKQTYGVSPLVGLWKSSLIAHLRVSAQLVELKNGETFNGHLVNCDNFMNITLREVYQTSAEGDRFWKVKECYIRGSTVCWRFPPPPPSSRKGTWSDRSFVPGRLEKVLARAGRAAGRGQGGTDARERSG